MPVQLKISVNDLSARAFLKYVIATTPLAVSRGINRVLFDLREGLAQEVATGLQWHAPNAKPFLASPRSWPITMSNANNLRGIVETSELAGRIIATQTEGYTLRPQQPSRSLSAQNLSRLYLGGLNNPTSFAIPDERNMRKLMSGRGRLPKAATPMGLLRRDAKRKARKYRRGRGRPPRVENPVFVNQRKTAMFERLPGGAVKRLFIFFQRAARVRPHLNTYDVAFRIVDKNLAPKVLEELFKVLPRG